MGRSLIQRSRVELGVFECDLDTSAMMRFRPNGAVEPWGNKLGKHKTSFCLAVDGYKPLASLALDTRKVRAAPFVPCNKRTRVLIIIRQNEILGLMTTGKIAS